MSQKSTPGDLHFVPGKNCGYVATADRVALLVDGEAYFSAFKHAALKARHAIYIVGWDFNSRIPLEFPDVAAPDVPNELGPFLSYLAERRPNLRIHVLNWDSPLLYKLDREWLPRMRIRWFAQSRAFFALDDQHPLGAAQHQKMVVIDDRMAFVGGIDFSAGRLDSRAHAPEDARRRGPDGKIPQPYHDIQIAVAGEAARAVGRIARERWRLATGEHLDAVDAGAGATGSDDAGGEDTRREDPWPDDPWPDDLAPELVKMPVAIARTRPAWKGLPEIREVETLYRDSIACARETIYIENQYLTSSTVADALRKRLEETGGPEIVIILPREPSGWIEQTAMGINQRRILSKLREADHEGRLHVYIPMTGDRGDVPIMVHAKAMIVDGRYARVGSSNLNNRSMGLDSECDIALLADPGSPESDVITGWRDGLLAEHLGCEREEVARAIAGEGSLAAAIAFLRREGRSLHSLPTSPPDDIDAMIAESGILDPMATSEPERLADELVDNGGNRPPFRKALVGLLVTLAIVTAFAAFWRFGPGAELVQAERVEDMVIRFSPGWWSGLSLMLAAYLLGGLVMFPVLVLIVATGLLYGPWTGLAVALAGSLASAALGYAVGAALGRNTVQRIAGKRFRQVSQALARRGIISVALIRMLPVAPFTLVNFAAGASQIRFRDYMAGTLLGMAPGITAITLFSGQLRAALTSADPVDIALLGIILAIIVGAAAWFWRRFGGRVVEGGGDA